MQDATSAQTKGFVPFVCAWHHILNLQKYNTIVFYRKFFGGSLSWCVILNKGALYVVQKKWIKMRNRPSLRDCAPHKQPSPNFLHSVVFVSPIGQLSNENIFCIMTLIKMQLTSRRTIPVHLNGRRVRRLKNGSKWSRLQSRVARLAFVTQTFVWGRINKTSSWICEYAMAYNKSPGCVKSSRLSRCALQQQGSSGSNSFSINAKGLHELSITVDIRSAICSVQPFEMDTVLLSLSVAG